MLFLIFIWGFSEATWFFIIPDVILSLYAIQKKSLKTVIKANLICVAGALMGGLLIYILSLNYYELIRTFILNVPAIHDYMITRVVDGMDESPLLSLITGPLFGVPYKLFALEAPQYIDLSMFLLFTVPARLIRFVLISLLAYYLSHVILKELKKTIKIFIWLVLWIIVYSVYFSIHPF